MMDASVLWRRLDQPGHETARVLFRDSCWHLTGTAIFVHNREACRLDYLVVCDSGWRTISGRVARWVADQDVDIELFFDSARRWRLNGSPSTNLLPIRRLGLAVGQEAKVRAAWLRFPGFSLEPLEQLYRRTDHASYRYESAGGSFVTDLQVNAAGFVTRYPGVWQIESGA